MAMITRPAIEVKQGRYNLYLTNFTVKHFGMDNFYSVDKLDTGERSGYQRVLNKTRMKSFARDIVAASKKNSSENNSLGECFYPTSVFLTT